MDMNKFLEKYATSREHTDCEKWDGLRGVFGEDGLLPMWVADMEFRACEAVTEALAARVRHGVFGYTFLPDSYYEAVSAWEQRFGYRPEREHIRCASGVVPAVYWLVNCFTEPGDAVAILTPVYYPFHDCVRDTGRRLVTCDLRYAAGRFEIDFAAFERSLADSGAKLFILCSPHNPAGRVWRADELDRLLGICRRRGVLVISDEIHQDFVFGASRHIAAPAVSGGRYADGVILVSAASKSFNLAGLNHANIFIPDPGLRARYDDWHRAVRPGGSSIMGQTFKRRTIVFNRIGRFTYRIRFPL